MSISHDDKTRISPKSAGKKQVHAGPDDATVKVTLPDGLDGPTRLAIASARRKKTHKTLAPGTLIKNRFRLEKQIGKGGMGVVYTARDLRKEEVGDTDSLIAIKLLTQELKEQPRALSLLQQECKKSQGLAHPNIVTVYDFDRDGDTFYMTMEYLTGQTLKQYILEHRTNPGTVKDILPIVKGIVEGLSYAHKKGIIHSDLKPANVFLTASGEVKILDFGIARAMMAAEPLKQKSDTGSSPDTSMMEHTSDIIGLTPNFASPEMFDGQPPDPRDDIYALGCISYYLLAGKHPFGRKPANKVREQHILPERIQGMKERQWNTLTAALALNRDKRLSTADELLRGFLPRKRERWRPAAIALGLCVAAISAYVYFKPPEIPDMFENPLPEAEISEDMQVRIDDALELAEVHLMVGRIISPPGGNALDQYNKVLKLQPYNREAINGLGAVMDNLATQADTAIIAGDEKSARALIGTGLSIYAKHKKLLALQQKLDSM